MAHESPMRMAMLLTAVMLALISTGIHASVATPHATLMQNNSSVSAVINQTAAYINTVNQSGYLIFYPNLTSSYSFLNKSKQAYGNNLSESMFYANRAKSSAEDAYTKIESYKYYSAITLLVLAIALGALIYLYMLPIKKGKAKRIGRRR